MKMRHYYFLLITLISVSSCGPLFQRRHIKVRAPENSAVIIDNEQLAVVGNGPTRVGSGIVDNKDIQIKKEGYKTHYDVLFTSRLNLGVPIGLLSFGGLALTREPVFIFGAVSCINARKTQKPNWKYDLVELPNYYEFSKEIKLTELQLDSNTMFTKKLYSSPSIMKSDGYHKFLDVSSSQEKKFHEMERDVFRRISNKLDSYGTQDTTNLNFNRHGDLTFAVQIISLSWNEFKINKTKEGKGKNCDMKALYKVKDHTGASVYNDTISSRSGNFWNSVLDHYVITDALEYGMIELLAQEEILSEMRSNAPHDFNAQLQEIGVSVTEGKSDPLELLDHAYFLTTEDEKILGLPVGKDGVLVFPKSSLTFIDDYKITDQDGNEYDGKPILDMALSELTFIQIDQQLEKTFNLRTSELDLVEEIYLVGADIYYQSAILSQGIVGGKRNAKDHLTYQTDAESGHMIWPFAIDKNGNICGVITRDVQASSMAFFPSIMLIE